MRIDQTDFGCACAFDGDIETVLQSSKGLNWPGIAFTDILLGQSGRVSIVQQGIQFAVSLAPRSQRFVWADRSYHFSEDSVAVLEPGAEVTQTWSGPYRCLVLKLAPEAVERVTGTSIAKTRLRTQFLPLREQVAVGHLLQAVSADLGNGAAGGALLVESVAATLLQLHAVADAPRRSASLTSAQATILRDRILAHLDEPLGLEQLAQAVGLSIGHLVRAFRASFGVTPYQFILRERVARAQDLIATGTMSLGAVAAAAGFSDSCQMAKTFRRLTGRPPRAFLRDARVQADARAPELEGAHPDGPSP